MKRSIDYMCIVVSVAGLLIGLSTGAFLDTTKTGQALKQKCFASVSAEKITGQYNSKMTR